jgi:2,3-bisphosphoglycerate-independent phosphoglycerate mutase
MTKYIILLGDGMSDEACKELNGQTPLEAAKTPALDWFSQHGNVGLVSTVPKELHPGSDVANMGVLGYDPRLYYSGRGPIEAAAMGITVPDDFIIFRCNLVTIKNEVMSDFTAGHISNDEGHQLLSELNTHFKKRGSSFILALDIEILSYSPKNISH